MFAWKFNSASHPSARDADFNSSVRKADAPIASKAKGRRMVKTSELEVYAIARKRFTAQNITVRFSRFLETAITAPK
jgi:hypothetical protein